MDRRTLHHLEAYSKFLTDSGFQVIDRAGLAPKPREESPLQRLESVCSTCIRCELSQTRTQVVFGAGNPQADLVFVGEAPGRDEDIQGKPFVGRAGKMLTKIINAMGLERTDVYICNVLKCRPPQNRNPLPHEIECCEPFLIEQLDIFQAKVICTLGKFASQTLLRTETPISKLRGSFLLYKGIKLMPTYHPAALLRNPRLKTAVWSDMQLIMKELGLKPRAKNSDE